MGINVSAIRRSVQGGISVVRKFAPEILAVVGTASVIGGTALCVKNTPKAYEQAKDVVDTLEMLDENDDQAGKIDLVKSYIPMYARWYGPGVTLIVGGIACLLGGNYILRRRLIMMTATAEALQLAYDTYRERVVENFGEEVDRALVCGDEIQVKSKALKVVENEDKSDETIASPYTVIFDEYNPNWEDDASANLLFLTRQLRFLNDRLWARGVLTLNEAREALGFDPIDEGFVTGWRIHPEWDHSAKAGDNFVDFGLFGGVRLPSDEQKREFVNGHNKAVVIEFNCDGVIVDL